MSLPSGTITLLFTDIEGSTRLLHELGDGYVRVLADHRRVLRAAVADHHGVEVDTQGDAFFIAFPTAPDAVAAAYDAQRGLASSPVRVRMGLHTGEPTVTAEGYVGIDVHRGARICAAGHGGQVLMSRTTRETLDQSAAVRDLGEHRLKDLDAPEWLFQLLASDLEHTFPPLRSLSNTNLPAEVSRFIGRRRELDELGALLRREDVRLVTLTGAGGSGKTRLAIRLGAEAVEQFKNGVFFVQLAALTDPGLVLATVAQTLGAKVGPAEDAAEALRRHLERKQTLLVLDNFEHLLSAAAQIGQLLAASPQLKVVVTSRERLRLAGEHEYAVSPLPENDAIALFGLRARAANPTFNIEAERRPVSAICQRLDGLPLALELAAARMKALSAQALLSRLEQRLPMLTGGTRDMPDRQRTLRATIEWSYLLLDAHEQEVLARLGVFVSGFDTASAAEVCGASLDDLASLHDKSLLRRDEGSHDESRFSMLETIREFAREALDRRGEANGLTEKHARYFARRFDRPWGKGIGGKPPGDGWSEVDSLAELETERENLQVSLAWLVENAEPNTAAQMVMFLWRLWLMHGPLADGRRWTERVLAKQGVSELPDYGQLLALASEFPRFQGDLARAGELLQQAIAVLGSRDEKARLASAIEGLADVLAKQGKYEQSRALHEKSLALGHELKSPFRIAHALNGLTTLAFLQRDYAQMEDLAREQLQISIEQKDDMYTGAAQHNLGEALRHRGILGPAAENYESARRIYERLGGEAVVAECIDGIGDIAAALGEFSVATCLWARSQRVLTEQGDLPWDAAGTEEGIAQARTALGPEAYEESRRWGSAMTGSEAATMAAQIVALAQAARTASTGDRPRGTE